MKRSYRYRIQEFSLTHLRYSRRRPALRSKISLPRPMNYFALTPIMATQALRHEKRYAIKSPFFTVRRGCMNEPDYSQPVWPKTFVLRFAVPLRTSARVKAHTLVIRLLVRGFIPRLQVGLCLRTSSKIGKSS